MFAESLKYIPGGVNSPVRAFRAVGGQPFFVDRAKGAYVFDVDGNKYVDYVCTWGPAILGHAHPAIIRAVQQAAENGTSFGIPNPFEVTMAKLVCEAVPSVQKVRMCNSGTEACMSVIRLARGFTKRDKIIKFDGCYHGHADSLLVKSGSGALTFGHPDSAGVPESFTQHTIVLPFNDTEAVQSAFTANKGQIAGIILEPVPGNAGLYLPKPGYLESLRKITAENDSLLIFDEVMTGFRVAPGGAQALYGVTPDLTCLGKIIGGGLPVAAYGGRGDLMDRVSPVGPIYQAGTLSGNPLAMVAGLWSLKRLSRGLYRTLSAMGHTLAAGLADAARSAGVPLQVNALGSMLTPFFTAERVQDYRSALSADTAAFAVFFREMLARGVYLPPSQFEAWFISSAHTRRDISKTIDAAREAMDVVAEKTKSTKS